MGFFASPPRRESRENAGDESRSLSSFGDDTPPRRNSPPRPNALPLSMQLMRPFCGNSCLECGASATTFLPKNNENDGDDILKEYDRIFSADTTSCVSPLVVAPMMHSPQNPEPIIAEYIAACQFYASDNAPRVNAGVLTTFRYCLPSLKVTGDFHDSDMLALADVMIRHGNGALRYIQRLDFMQASKQGRLHKKLGFQSHGAFALAKMLQNCHYIQHVRLSRHKVGPFGASAIFLAASNHPFLRILEMRRCRIMEQGGMAFAELLCCSTETKLQDVDLSANHIGLRASIAIEQELSKRSDKLPYMQVDLEANLVFQEVCTFLL